MAHTGTATPARHPKHRTVPANTPLGVDGFTIPRRARWIGDCDSGCWARYIDDTGYIWSIAIKPGHRSSHYGTRRHFAQMKYAIAHAR